jgi:hypothetical protein
MIYPQWKVNGSHLVSFLPDLALIGSFLVFWHYRRTWGRPLLFALGYFVIALLPVMGFFKMSYMAYAPVADHFQYVAMIGIIALLTGTAVYFYDKLHWRIQKRPMEAFGASVVIIGILSVLSWQQQHIYKDDEALWINNASTNPNSWVAYYNLGFIYYENGLYDQAISDYSKAIEINPNYTKAYTNRGVAYYKKALYDQAISDYNKAIEIDPHYAVPYFDKGVACEMEDHKWEAIEAYQRFLQHAPPQYSYIERARWRIKELKK